MEYFWRLSFNIANHDAESIVLILLEAQSLQIIHSCLLTIACLYKVIDEMSSAWTVSEITPPKFGTQIGQKSDISSFDIE